MEAEEQARYDKAVKATHPNASSLKAKYKVEIIVFPWKDGQMVGKIMRIMSGSDKHGGGDMPVFTCTKCKTLIHPWNTAGGYFACPGCGYAADAMYTSDGALFKGDYKVAAKLIYQYWVECDQDAHIFLRRSKVPIHKYVQAVQEKDYFRMEKYKRELQENKELCIYSLDRIMADNLSGADMLKRFETFMRA